MMIMMAPEASPEQIRQVVARLEATGTVPRSVAAAHAAPHGSTIIVGTSDTLEVLAQRYHVAPAAILAANGYKGPRTLSPGQQLIIPSRTATAAAPAMIIQTHTRRCPTKRRNAGGTPSG